MGSGRLQSKASATKIMKLMGASVACIFAFAIPFWYYILTVHEMRDSLAIETAFLAKSIEKTIQIRPDMWEWEVIRMEEIASQPSLLGKRCEREIRTASGRMVAKTDFTVSRPVIRASVTFFDSGRPVGSIQAIFSIRAQIIFTALLGIFSSLLGYLIYFLFRAYPIRKLDSTLAELQQAEEEQHRSREIAEQLAEETTVIAEIGKLIGSTLDIDEVYERVAVEARKLIPFDRLAINLYNFQENTSRVAYFSGLSIRDRGPGDSVPLAGSFSEELIRTQTSLLFQPKSSDEIDEIVARFPPLSSTFQAGLLSLMGIPLVYRNEAIGVLHFRSKKPNAYTERDLHLAERIGAQIAGAIANAQLFADLKKAEEEQRLNRKNAERLAEEMGIIAEIGRVTGSTLNIEEVYERFAEEVHKIILFDRIVINIIDVEMNTITNVYVAGQGITDRNVGVSYPLKGSGNIEMVYTKSSLLIQAEDFNEYKDRYPMLLSTFQAGFRSIMNIPLFSKGEVVGGLLLRSFKPNAYTDKDVRLAERVGNQIAGAIVNAQLFAEVKKTEMSLRESEGRFRALVEQAAVGVAEVDMVTNRFLTINRRLCEMVGRTEEELMATTFQAITHPEDLHLHEEKTALLLAGKIGHYNLEKRYLRKDGEIVWVNLTTSPLWKPGEKPGRNMIVVEDITERKKMETEMREMSLRDLLTELYNRRGFITLAEQQIKVSNRAKKPLKLTFIDCDGLKWINDTLGHKEGDQALIDTAHVLRQTFRESDIIARLGGDEFAILSIDAADMRHEDFSRRLQQHIDEINERESRLYKLSLSWGTAMYHPKSPMSLDQLISAADELMYAQKKSKSNRRA